MYFILQYNFTSFNLGRKTRSIKSCMCRFSLEKFTSFKKRYLLAFIICVSFYLPYLKKNCVKVLKVYRKI